MDLYYPHMNPIAHVRPLENGSFVEQPLCGSNGHLEGVAELASKFAKAFNAGEIAECVAFLHDIGKFKTDFQEYIRSQSGYECEESDEFGVGRVDHSAAGAIWAFRNIPGFGLLLSYIIAGHHSGLPDFFKDGCRGSGLDSRLSEISHLTDSQENGGKEYLESINKPCLTQRPVNDSKNLHLWVRMLFSCLVDADFLDTERFMNEAEYSARSTSCSLEELRLRYDLFMKDKSAKAQASKINSIRSKILAECRQGALKEPGLFSLTVPTGGGKTLASMGFALDHAIKWKKSRIIVAIPFTSIIEQTAQVYRNVFAKGDEDLSDVVLEHHSNLDPDKETLKSRLATENWDAPIVVTTNVQLLESLFAAKTSRCRKLHNIANSVIILDEAQTLPPEYLKPILATLESLTTDFGCSIVLCTATQPALQGIIGMDPESFEGLQASSVRELMSNPIQLFDDMNRTKVQYLSSKKFTWDEIASRLVKCSQVLCIVNTRKDCKTLYDLMPEGTIHLSASMCGLHRSKVIAEIKQRLKNGEPIRVISTQLVEAGVDIDFPVVYRAMAGLDSVAQAAGRCNREGRLEHGQVYLFNPPREAPVGLIRFGAQATLSMLQGNANGQISLSPSRFRDYFKRYYGQVHSFDKAAVMKSLDLCLNNMHAQFKTAANNFKMIDNEAQKSVIVWYEDENIDSRSLIEQLKLTGPNRKIMRKLQRYTVNIPQNYWNDLKKLGYIEEIQGPNGGLDLWQQAISSLYSEKYGFSLDGPEFHGSEFIC